MGISLWRGRRWDLWRFYLPLLFQQLEDSEFFLVVSSLDYFRVITGLVTYLCLLHGLWTRGEAIVLQWKYMQECHNASKHAKQAKCVTKVSELKKKKISLKLPQGKQNSKITWGTVLIWFKRYLSKIKNRLEKNLRRSWYGQWLHQVIQWPVMFLHSYRYIY